MLPDPAGSKRLQIIGAKIIFSRQCFRRDDALYQLPVVGIENSGIQPGGNTHHHKSLIQDFALRQSVGNIA